MIVAGRSSCGSFLQSHTHLYRDDDDGNRGKFRAPARALRSKSWRRHGWACRVFHLIHHRPNRLRAYRSFRASNMGPSGADRRGTGSHEIHTKSSEDPRMKERSLGQGEPSWKGYSSLQHITAEVSASPEFATPLSCRDANIRNCPMTLVAEYRCRSAIQ